MYPPLFRFNTSGESLFFELLNRQNGTTVTPLDILVGHPRKLGRTLTEISISSTKPLENPGSVFIKYERLDLSTFFFGVPVTISTNEIVDETLLSQEILSKWRLLIEPEDIEITRSGFGPYYPEKINLRIKESSLCWVGEIEVWVLNTGNLLSLFENYPLSFNNGNIKHNGYLYSIERQMFEIPNEIIDYLEYGRVIHTLDTESIVLLDYLKDKTKDNWVIQDTVIDYNLKGSKVIYHGPYSDDIEDTVVVIELGTNCKNLFGYLVLNLPRNLNSLIHITDLDGF